MSAAVMRTGTVPPTLAAQVWRSYLKQSGPRRICGTKTCGAPRHAAVKMSATGPRHSAVMSAARRRAAAGWNGLLDPVVRHGLGLGLGGDGCDCGFESLSVIASEIDVGCDWAGPWLSSVVVMSRAALFALACVRSESRPEHGLCAAMQPCSHAAMQQRCSPPPVFLSRRIETRGKKGRKKENVDPLGHYHHLLYSFAQHDPTSKATQDRRQQRRWWRRTWTWRISTRRRRVYIQDTLSTSRL